MDCRSYSILCKPAGASCNIKCDYCFYLDKKELLNQPAASVMSERVLERFISQYLMINTLNEVEFVWQGGEPMLCGLEFYKMVVLLQKKYGSGRKILNILQTNGTLLTDSWCEFLAENKFLVGISIDGPEDIHNTFRCNRDGNGTFSKVMQGIDLLKKHRIPYNTLTVLNSENVTRIEEVYSFLKEIGTGYMQFIPMVERMPAIYEEELGMTWSEPPGSLGYSGKKIMSPISITPKQFGDFYIGVFEKWRKDDVGKQAVQFFEATLGMHLGKPPGLCYFERVCGHAGALEYNGDLYSCDHFVYPKYLLGNIFDMPLWNLMEKNRDFGISKALELPKKCLDCEVGHLCNGGCIKHRFCMTEDGEKGLNYLCEGYYAFFTHTAEYFQEMQQSILQGHKPADTDTGSV